MALNSSGPISLAGATTGESIALELGQSATGQISLNDTAVRSLAGVTTPGSTIVMPTNFWGKSNYYTVDNSMRYRSSASAYLNRTPGASGNNQKFTFSTWVKKSVINANGSALLGVNAGGGYGGLGFSFGLNANDDLGFSVINTSSSNQIRCGTAAVFRDVSAWYHIVLAVDTTQATNSNGVKIYVNGVQQTLSFSTYVQNTNCYINLSGYGHLLGAGQSAAGGRGGYLDAFQAETYLIDGQQLTPSSFGATNAATGVWQPAQYTGTYGTNGFYLKFSDIATTSGSNAGLGKDFSGNGNYWTTNNISVTSGVTYDAMTDSPTWKSSTVANYPTMNPLKRFNSNPAYSWANLRVGDSSASNSNAVSSFSFGTSGKYYFEATATDAFGSASGVGVVNVTYAQGTSTYGMRGGYRSNGSIYNQNDTLQTSGASYTSGDVIGIAVDVTSGTVQFYKNNVAQGATPSYTFTAGTELWVTLGFDNQSGAKTFDVNFGQRPFAYTPPTGFNRLNTYNIPTPTIGATSSTLAGQYFNAVLYSGNGTTNTVTGLGFQPDFLWFKNRNGTGNNSLNDTNRGITKRLISDSTNAEDTISSISSLNSDGFVLTGNDGAYNYSVGPRTYVTWCWKANAGTNSTNTNGSITSTVQANTTSGFSIVTVTSPNGGTVGHGLGVAPSMMIAKRRDSTSNWMVQHKSAGVGYLILQSTQAYAGGDPSVWNGQFPSSSVIYTASGGYFASGNFVIYCFAEVAGFSKFGSYTGNGSSDGPFVYCGFRPAYIMVKRSDSTGAWFVLDNKRDTYNYAYHTLNPNASDSEYSSTSNAYDFLSNGFKLRQTNADQNASGGTYIFMAFAESPFNYSNAR